MTMTMNDDLVKIRRDAQREIDFINELIRIIEMASGDDPEFYSKRKRIILDPFPLHSWDEQKRWLKDLKKKKIIGDFEESQDCFYLFRPIKMLLYQERQKLLEIVNPPQKQIQIEGMKTAPSKKAIKDVRLDETNYLLEVNKGENFISFKSKKGGAGLEKETKVFKILFHLWDFRQEVKNGKITLKGNPASLNNLKRGSGCPTDEAIYQHIKRINKLFETKGLPIKIEGDNGKYMLIIYKS